MYVILGEDTAPGTTRFLRLPFLLFPQVLQIPFNEAFVLEKQARSYFIGI